jgi:hypothetical protein
MAVPSDNSGNICCNDGGDRVGGLGLGENCQGDVCMKKIYIFMAYVKKIKDVSRKAILKHQYLIFYTGWSPQKKSFFSRNFMCEDRMSRCTVR